MAGPKKVNLNSIKDLSTTCDDKLGELFGSLGYVQDFKLVDLKLALGYTSVLIAGGLFYLDKKYSFSETYYLTLVACIAYAILSIAVYYVASYLEKNIKFVGTHKKDKITIETSTYKYEPIYNVKITLNKKTIDTKIEFTKLFDAFGYLNEAEFRGFFVTELQKITEKSK